MKTKITKQTTEEEMINIADYCVDRACRFDDPVEYKSNVEAFDYTTNLVEFVDDDDDELSSKFYELYQNLLKQKISEIFGDSTKIRRVNSHSPYQRV